MRVLKSTKNDYIDCNSFDIELDTPIYRIISMGELKNIFELSSFSLSKPGNWKDPYETFLFNQNTLRETGDIISFKSLKENIYCSCWSLLSESEDLWKSYSDESFMNVKIKSTPRKIMKYFYDITNKAHYLSYFCGKVIYVSKSDIDDVLSKNVDNYFTSMNYMSALRSLFVKRLSFEHEQEIRFVFYAYEKTSENIQCANKWDVSDKYFYYKVAINDIIEEIVIHPLLDKNKAILLEEEIKNKNFLGKIYQSTLYKRNDRI